MLLRRLLISAVIAIAVISSGCKSRSLAGAAHPGVVTVFGDVFALRQREADESPANDETAGGSDSTSGARSAKKK